MFHSVSAVFGLGACTFLPRDAADIAALPPKQASPQQKPAATTSRAHTTSRGCKRESRTDTLPTDYINLVFLGPTKRQMVHRRELTTRVPGHLLPCPSTRVNSL